MPFSSVEKLFACTMKKCSYRSLNVQCRNVLTDRSVDAICMLRVRMALLVHAFVLLLILQGRWISVAEGKKSIHIPDDLDDVVDDEEDDAWKQWGKRKPSDPPPFDPPPDMAAMDPSQMQSEMLSRHFGPSYGFVKLRLGVPRTKEEVPKIARKWTELLRTGSIDAKFMAVDVNTVMFTMQEGRDTAELKEFVLSQPEAYEFKLGQQAYRRPGDPPLEEVVDKLNAEYAEANDDDTVKEWHHKEDEL